MSGTLDKRDRALLYRAQRGICSGCGLALAPLDKRRLARVDIISADHTYPRSRGGQNRLGNITLMHTDCNEWKGDAKPTGCEIIWLIAVNAYIGIQPAHWWLNGIVPPGTKMPTVRRLK